MVAYLTLVQEVTSRLKGLSVTQIPREEYTQVDRLAHLASSSESDLQEIRVKYLSEPSVSSPDPILMYLTIGSLLAEKFEVQYVKFRAASYHVINGVLYKRGYTLPYLRCIHLN